MTKLVRVVAFSLLFCLEVGAEAQEAGASAFQQQIAPAESLETRIRDRIKESRATARRIGLENFIKVEADRLSRQVDEALSFTGTKKSEALDRLNDDVRKLAATIRYRPRQQNWWGPKEATGKPDTSSAGDHPTAWNPKEENAGAEWLKLTYDQKVDVATVRVHETFNPGAITSITASTEGGDVVIWADRSGDATAPNWLEANSTAAARTDTITLHLDTSLKQGWNEIDAVELVGTDGRRQWATKAESSSVFSGPGQGPVLTLNGQQVNDEWLAACAANIVDAEQVSLYNTSVTDAGLAHLRSLKDLTRLVLRCPELTGAGLKNLSAEKLANLNLANSGVTDSGLKSLAALPNIDTLILSRTAITDDGLVHLQKLPNLVSLDLTSTHINGSGLAHLESHAKLKTLRLGDSTVTNDGLSHIPPLPSLENLTLRSTGVTSLASLTRLKSLKNVDLNETQIDDAGLAKLAEYPDQIETLSLIGTRVTGDGLRHLASMANLSFLNLRDTAVTEEGLKHLQNLAALKYLYLSSTPVTGIDGLGDGLTNLEILDLRDTHVDDAGLAGLASFPRLQHLYLANTSVRGTGLAGLSSAKELRRLDLNGTSVNDSGLVGVVELPKLGRLELSSTRVTDATLNRVADAGRLTYLDIYGTNVTADGLRRLSSLTGLRELYAGGTAADDSVIAALGGLDKILHLDLQGTRVTDAALETIGKFKNLNSLNLARTGVTGSTVSKLSGIEELRTLNLAGTETTDEALNAIATVLVRAVNPDNGSGGGFAWLNNLILTDTAVSDAGLANISRLKHINTLRLDGTNVTDQGVKQIARLPELQSLHLAGTAVSNDGIAALSNSTNLRTLGLTGTEITDDALRHVGESIQELSLGRTSVTDAGVQELANRKELEVLELAGTNITDRSLELISKLPTLRIVDLSATAVTDRGIEALKALPALTEVRLDRTSVTNIAAETLATFPALSAVSLIGTRVTADGKGLLGRRRPELTVTLDWPWIDPVWTEGESAGELPWSISALPEDISIADLQRNPTVRSLSFQHRSVDAKVLVALHKLPQLESLNLSDTSVDDTLLADLSGLTQLRVLRLCRTAITDDGLKHLAALPALQLLDLDGTHITGAGLEHLNGLNALRSIRLRETLLQDEHATNLATIGSLREIALSNTGLGDAGLREFERLPALRYLDLFGTRVTDDGLKSIGRLRSLSHLYLNKTAVTDDGLAALVGLRELVELGLEHCEITDRGLQHVTGFEHLERLRLSGSHVTDAGAVTLAGIKTLRKLELNNTAVSDGAIGDLLKLTDLEQLELNGTRVSDHGLESLTALDSLERLNIRDTDVTQPAVETFQQDRPEVALAFGAESSRFSWFGIALSVLYGLIALTICIYGAHRYLLAWLFVRRDVRRSPQPMAEYSELPRVTIQLPMFNERNVVERIITAACSMDYPRDRLQIQVLDDSTDECTELARRCCERFRGAGLDIEFLHRNTRDGFKSGALAAGLESATGELVAIFDADFVPESDFLLRTVHHFTDKNVGVVQTECRHLNRNESTLTQCQAMFLDGHFVVEQATRAATGRWFNFNGTAGVWRRSCIDKAGGWQHETLTEDTDLSYRAQLQGWRFVYLPDVQVAAELPSTMSAFLGQQHRWTRGLLQCAVKLMPRILTSHAPFRVKAEAWFHLTAPILYAVMFGLTALAIPATFVAMPLSELRGATAWALGGAILLAGTIGAAVFILIGQKAAGQSLWRTIVRLPALLALGIGMSAVNTRAAVGALFRVRSPFVRTPKFGGRSDSEADPDARRSAIGLPVGIVELLVAGVLFACLVLGLSNDFVLIGAPFLLLFAAGFLWVGGARFVESGRRVAVSASTRSPAWRWPTAAAVAATAVVAVLGMNSIRRPVHSPTLASRLVGIDLTRADWNVRGSSVARTESGSDGVTLGVKLNPEDGAREEGEIFIDLKGSLASFGSSLSDAQELVFDVAVPRSFSGELQAFVTDSDGNSQYGTIAFVERHDTRGSLRVGIAPGSLTPPMGYSDPDFDGQRSIQRVGLKVSAQSDRVRGQGYRPFHGELTVASVRAVPRNHFAMPEIRSIAADAIQRPQPTPEEEFHAASGADRPWPLGYAFSGPLSPDQRTTLDETYGALQQRGLGFTRVYIGDYRTGLIFDADGSVTGIEPEFLDYLDGLAEIANRHDVTVMFSLMDNTLLDGKGVEFPQFVVDRKESDKFIVNVLAPVVSRLSERTVVWDLFNEPENVAGASLAKVQKFVDRALLVLRKADSNAKFTVVSRSARELVYWRGRGLDILSHNVFDQRNLESAMSLTSVGELDAPVWIAEIDPALATKQNLESLRLAGYRGVGLWGWATGDKYDWAAAQLQQVVCPLLPIDQEDKCVQADVGKRGL